MIRRFAMALMLALPCLASGPMPRLEAFPPHPAPFVPSPAARARMTQQTASNAVARVQFNDEVRGLLSLLSDTPAGTNRLTTAADLSAASTLIRRHRADLQRKLPSGSEAALGVVAGSAITAVLSALRRRRDPSAVVPPSPRA